MIFEVDKILASFITIYSILKFLHISFSGIFTFK